jgi:ABC-type branched-subunit amino acid transport system substrate-binding protein
LKKILISIFIIFAFLIYFFNEQKYYNNNIVLGASLPKTGIMKDWGHNVEIGTNAYFKYVNEKGILPNNKKISLISLDDKYEPNLTIENTNKLLERKDLFAFYGYVGTPTVKKILPIIENNSIPFIAPFTGASFLRDKNKQNIVNFRASYYEEIDKIIEYLNTKKKIKKFAVFYQNDDYGEEGFVSTIKSLRSRDLALNGEGMYKRNTLSIKHAFSEIRDSKPEAIIMVGAYQANALFIKKAKMDPVLKDSIFCIISFGDASAIVKDLNYETQNIIFSQVVPSFDNYRIEIIREYKYMMRRYYPKESLGFISLEAFLVAKSVVESIKNIKGPLSKNAFLKEWNRLPKEILRGIKLEHKKDQLSNKVYLFKYEESTFKEINKDD